MQNKYNYLDLKNLKEGQIGYIPIFLLKPSQPDDKKRSIFGDNPIEITKDKENIIIVHGNHRYYRNIEKNPQMNILSRVVKNLQTFINSKLLFI